MKQRWPAAAFCGLCALLLWAVEARGAMRFPQDPPAAKPEAKMDERARRQQAYLRFIEAQRLRGEAQRSQNARRLSEAIEAYQEAIRLDPTASEPHVDLGELYFFYQSRLDLAEREGQEAVKLDPQNVSGHLLLARLYITALRFEKDKEQQQRQIERARRAYEEVTRLDPHHMEAWAMLSEIYELRNEPAQQQRALERWSAAPVSNDASFYRWLMNQDLSPDQAYHELSQLYRRQGNVAAALKAGRKAYELEPDSALYARSLVGLLRNSESIEEELRTYAQLLKTSDSPALQIGYGSALLRAGRYEEAATRLRSYVKTDPTNASAIGLLSLAERRAGQRGAAVETLKAGLKAVEAGARLNLQLDLGETYEEMGRNEEAIAQYEAAFETFFQRGASTAQNLDLFAHVINRLARVYRRTGQTDRLQAAFTRARPVVGERSPALELLTIEGLREEGKQQAALEQARVAARRFPEDRSLRFTEALILTDLRQYGEAGTLLRGMLKGTPEFAAEDATVYLLLSSVEMQSGDFKAAEEAVRRALALNPDDAELLIQLGSVQDRAGHPEAAERTLRELLRRDPENATALNNLGYLLVERGKRLEEAFGLIERAVNLEPLNGSFLDSLGWAHYKLGRVEKAREQLERAVVYARRSAALHEHLGDVLYDLGRAAEARRQWEKALEYSVEADEIARLKDKLKEGR
jgi:tetratricopeptide (TPR) repeat protein